MSDQIFILSFHLQSNAAINLKIEPDHGAMLRDFYPYIHTRGHMNKQHWISVYEDDEMDKSLVKDLVLNSYELVISKLKKVERIRVELLLNVEQ